MTYDYEHELSLEMGIQELPVITHVTVDYDYIEDTFAAYDLTGMLNDYASQTLEFNLTSVRDDDGTEILAELAPHVLEELKDAIRKELS